MPHKIQHLDFEYFESKWLAKMLCKDVKFNIAFTANIEFTVNVTCGDFLGILYIMNDSSVKTSVGS